MSRVVAVVGGGISGLAAARVLAGGEPVGGQNVGRHDFGSATNLRRRARRRGRRAGGGRALRRQDPLRRVPGRSVDFGPDNFLTRDPSAAELCRQLGLGDDLVAAGDELGIGPRAGVGFGPLPAGLVLGIPTDLAALARSGIVSGPGLARAALDLVMPGAPIRASSVGCAGDRPGAAAGRAGRHPDRKAPEWNAASILERRLGREVVERLVDPVARRDQRRQHRPAVARGRRPPGRPRSSSASAA